MGWDGTQSRTENRIVQKGTCYACRRVGRLCSQRRSLPLAAAAYTCTHHLLRRRFHIPTRRTTSGSLPGRVLGTCLRCASESQRANISALGTSARRLPNQMMPSSSSSTSDSTDDTSECDLSERYRQGSSSGGGVAWGASLLRADRMAARCREAFECDRKGGERRRWRIDVEVEVDAAAAAAGSSHALSRSPRGQRERGGERLSGALVEARASKSVSERVADEWRDMVLSNESSTEYSRVRNERTSTCTIHQWRGQDGHCIVHASARPSIHPTTRQATAVYTRTCLHAWLRGTTLGRG